MLEKCFWGFLMSVCCQARGEEGRAPHWTLLAMLTLTKTFIFDIRSHSGLCQIFDIFVIKWAEMVSQLQKSLQLTASIFFSRFSWMQPERCRERRKEGV